MVPDAPSSTLEPRAPSPRRGPSLTDWLAANPDIALAAEARPPWAAIDLLRVPEGRRRRGLGAFTYRLWEAMLPDGVVVELFAVGREAEAFWRSLGFEGTGDGPMRKTVARGARTV